MTTCVVHIETKHLFASLQGTIFITAGSGLGWAGAAVSDQSTALYPDDITNTSMAFG